jgi:hypothetical protein
MTNNDLKDLLYEAQEHLNEAIRLLDNYVRETGDSNAEAYIVDHLRIYAGRDHGFLSRDLNIDDLLERVDDHEPDEADDNNLTTDWIAQCVSGNMAWSNELRRYVAIPDNEG